MVAPACATWPHAQAYPVYSVLRFALTDAEERHPVLRRSSALLSMQTEEQKERFRPENEAMCYIPAVTTFPPNCFYSGLE